MSAPPILRTDEREDGQPVHTSPAAIAARMICGNLRQLITAHTGEQLTGALAARIIEGLNKARRILKGTDGKEGQRAKQVIRQRMRSEHREQLHRQVFALYGNRCACCGETDARFFTIDHIVPIRRRAREPNLYHKILSGSEPREKYQVLCVSCNWLKGAGERCPCGRG